MKKLIDHAPESITVARCSSGQVVNPVSYLEPAKDYLPCQRRPISRPRTRIILSCTSMVECKTLALQKDERE